MIIMLKSPTADACPSSSPTAKLAKDDEEGNRQESLLNIK
jgi:hypothetical protein